MLLLLLLELALLLLLPPELLLPLLLLEEDEELELELAELGRVLPLELEFELGRLTLPESLLPLGRVPSELALLAGRTVLLELDSLLPLGRVLPEVVLPLAGRTVVVPLLPLLPELLSLGRVEAPPPLFGVGLVGVRELMLPAVLEPLLGRTTVASEGLL